jgi:hypothetical protein
MAPVLGPPGTSKYHKGSNRRYSRFIAQDHDTFPASVSCAAPSNGKMRPPASPQKDVA